jgi:hypothetical protein
MTTGDAEPPVTYNAILASKGKIMNDGVKILLERMETHPEEFVIEEGIPAKWDSLVRSYEAVLDPEDIALFKQARNKLLRQQFTEKVLEELVDPVRKLTREEKIPLAGQIPAISSDDVKNAQKLMKIHVDAHMEALKKESLKTKFGKLFNYQ